MPFMGLLGSLLCSQRAALEREVMGMRQTPDQRSGLLGSLDYYRAALGQQVSFDTRYVGQTPLYVLFDKKGIPLRDELQKDVDEWLADTV